MSAGGLKAWCEAAGVQPHDARDLSRLLRSVLLAEEDGWKLTEFLNIVNPRTESRLLERGQCVDLRRKGRCSVEEFCSIQSFVQNPTIIDAVLRLVRDGGLGSSRPEPPVPKSSALTAILTSVLTVDLTVDLTVASVIARLCS